MHMETYPAFLTPRDKEPSLSSSEEKSLEFDQLERKITRKQKYIYIYMKEKQSKCSIKYIFSYTKGCLQEQAPEIRLYHPPF